MKTKEECIREVVSCDDKIFQVISQAPQTYNTILQTQKDCGTLQVILRRRVSRMLKEDRILRVRVPGTRFGLTLLCSQDRDYKIIVSDNRLHHRVFYCFDYDEMDTKIVLHNYWELKGPNWSRWVYCDDELNISKGGLLRLWE